MALNEDLPEEPVELADASYQRKELYRMYRSLVVPEEIEANKIVAYREKRRAAMIADTGL